MTGTGINMNGLPLKNKPKQSKGKKKSYPDWVCFECGNKASKKHFQVSTWHRGTCGVCGKVKDVTEPRDFYYPKFKGCLNT
uniref:Uncharacterized protein n=1 Tax=viral metagenome TaxID=1070528 RepID=A0A6M3IVB8_9ZZZZ